jgi:hypothetical protein
LAGDAVAISAIYNDIVIVEKQLLLLETLVCDSCSGFGHTSTDWRKGKDKPCPTQDTIDVIVKLCLGKKDAYLKY